METSSVGLDNSAVTAFLLTDATTWWQEINDSPLWQDHIFLTLAALYGIVAIVALVGSFALFRYLFVRVSVFFGTEFWGIGFLLTRLDIGLSCISC